VWYAACVEFMKVVGRRARQVRHSAAEALAFQDEVARMFGTGPLCDRGLFRFESFDEADEWLTEQRARKHRERRRSATSDASRTS